MAQKCFMLFPGQAQIFGQTDVTLRPVLPLLGTVLNMRQLTPAIEVLFFECLSFQLLSSLIFPAQGKLPIIKSLIVGVPGQPPAIHSVLSGCQIDS